MIVRIAVNTTLIVAQDQVALVPPEGVFGKQRYFSAAARSINHKGRNGVARGVATQILDDFDSFRNRSAEVFQTHR